MSKLPPFDPALDGPEPKYVRLADHMQAQIAAGELNPKLDSERDLSEEYHVSVGTIRKTAKVLRERGLIKTSHGRGTYLVGGTADPSVRGPAADEDDDAEE